MKVLRIALVLLLVAAAGGALVLRDLASAQAQTIKIGVLYDHTGPFSAAGSLNCWRGAKMMIDLINERGGVLGKYKIVHEDGAYGADVALGNELKAKELGLNVVLKEGYSISAPDLSALVTKLRSVRPDVLFHTGYNPDIALFVRQATEQGLRLRA